MAIAGVFQRNCGYWVELEFIESPTANFISDKGYTSMPPWMRVNYLYTVSNDAIYQELSDRWDVPGKRCTYKFGV